MNQDNCFHLGHVVKVHGLKGEINILIDADDPEYYKEMESVFVEINKQLIPFFIERFQLRGKHALVKFEDIDHSDKAQELIGCDLYLPTTALPQLGESQFYFHDIVGYMAIDQTLGELGPIETVYSKTGQDLLAINHKNQEILVPLIDEFIVSVDKENKTFHLNLPDGLVEVYMEQSEQ